MKKTHSSVALILTALLFSGTANLPAAATWNGANGLNWNDPLNWTGTVTPSATEALTFAGSTNLTNNNDFAPNSQFNTLTFASGAGSFVLGGAAINLGNGTTGSITNSSSVGQTINNNIALLQTTTIATGATSGSGITLGGNISGTGFGISTSGAGGLILSGSNSYSGTTSLTTTTTLRAVANGGNTTLGISSALSPNSVITLQPSSTSNIPVIQLRADDNTTFNTAGVTLTAVGTQNRAITINVDNAGSGSNKTLTLGGNFTANTTGSGVNATTVNITGGNEYSLALGTVSNTGGTGGNLNFNATANLTIAALANAGAEPNYNFVGSGHTTITGNMTRATTSKAMTVNQSGSGSLTLQGVASTIAASAGAGYTFNLNSGTLNLNNAGAIGDGGSGTNVTYNRTFNIGGGTTLDNTSGADITVLNNKAASTTAVQFVTNINGDFIFGTNGANSKALALDVGGGTSTGQHRGYITLGGSGSTGTSRTITANGDDYLGLNGAIIDGVTANALVKEGAARLVLGKANFYSGGTTVKNGVLEVNGDSAAAQSAISGTTATSATNAANFNITGINSSVVANLRVGQVVTGTNIPAGTIVTGILGTQTIGISKPATAVGTVNDLAFSAGGGLGTGAVSVTGGTLLVNSTGNINNTTAVTVTGGTFQYDGTTALNRDVTLSSGKFVYNNASSAYTGTLNYTGGTIGGSNLSGIALSIGTNQTMSPGNSTGTMTAGATTWAPGGTFLFELNDTTGAAGLTGWDLLNASSLSITALDASKFTIQIASLNGSQVAGNALNFDGTLNYKWLFVDAGSNITTFDASLFTLNDSAFTNSTPGSFSISQGDGLGGDLDKLYINYTGVIPEPSTYAMLIGGLGLLAFLRRRRA